MAKSKIYVGLEIGTSKVCFVVGEVRKDGAVEFLGYGIAPSRGVHKGEIIDAALLEKSLCDALIRAEDSSEVMIRHVFVGVTGSHIQSLNHTGKLPLPSASNQITKEDLEDVREDACQVEVPSNHVILHRIARKYVVDGQDQVRNLVGRTGSMLEASFHLIHGVRSRIQNTFAAVRNIPLDVEDVVFMPIAASYVVLSKESKQLGSLMIDIGAGTTDYAMFVNGMLTASGSIPLGGDSITNDIALCFQIPHRLAEKLKLDVGSTRYADIDPEDVIKVQSSKEMKSKNIPTYVLNEVIYLRTHEILSLVKERCKAELSHLGAGVYLTGGVSRLRGIEEVAKDVFKMKVTCVGENSHSQDEGVCHNPTFSSCVGLIRYAQLMDSGLSQQSAFQRVLKKFIDVFS